MAYLQGWQVMTLKEARKIGINAMMLSRAVQAGWLHKPAPSIYTDDPDLQFDLLKKYLPVTVKCKEAVVALVSALTFHELTDEEERELWFALPHSKKFRHQKGVRITRLSGKAYSLGIEYQTVGERKIAIYSREKSVVDAFKYLSLDVAIKALKSYLKQPKIDVEKLLNYSKQLKKPLHEEVRTIMTV